MHKSTTPKMFGRTTPPRRSVPEKSCIATCPLPRQNCGNIHVLIGWATFTFEISNRELHCWFLPWSGRCAPYARN